EARGLFKTLEELVGCSVAITVAGEIQSFPLAEVVSADNQPEHPDDLRSLHIGNSINQLVRVIKPFTDYAAGMSGIFNGKRTEQGVTNAVHLKKSNKRWVKCISLELTLYINCICFIKPDIKRRVHGSL